MGSIPGPVLTIKIDSSTLSGSLTGVMNQVRQQTKAAADASVETWKRAAAQIRASVSQGLLTDKEVTAQRQQLVTILDKELSGLRTRNELTRQELATLKAATLERERQASFLRGSGGITSGTSNALGQLSGQTLLGFERILDSVVNRYLGGAAGAATRLLRDVTYYGGLGAAGSGAASAEGAAAGGIFGNLGKSLSSVTEAIGPANIALGGFLATLTAVGAIGASVTVGLAKENEQFENLANVTGLSSKEVQIFTQLAKEQGLEVTGMVTSIARFQAELGQYIRKSGEASAETIRFVAGAKSIGVSVEDASGHLRPTVQIISDLSDALKLIPDPTERSARTLDILGVRGRELAPILLSNKGNISDLISAVEKSGPIIDEQMSAKLDVAKTRWDALNREIGKTWLTIKEGISNGYLSLFSTGLERDVTLGQALFPQKFRDTTGVTIHDPNPEALQRAREISAGSKLAADLEEKRKQLNEAIKNSQGEQALQLARQVKFLEEAVKKAKQIEDSYVRAFQATYALAPRTGTGRPNLIPSPNRTIFHPFDFSDISAAPQVSSDSFLGGPSPIPGPIGAIFGDTLTQLLQTGVLAGVSPADNQAAKDKVTALLKQIGDAHDDLFTTQLQKDREHYEDEFNDLELAHQNQLISDERFWEARAQVQQEWQKTLNDLNKKYADEAGKLFDDLLGGKMKDFGRGLLGDLRNIFLAPIKSIFEQQIGGVFGGLSRLAGAPFQGIQQIGLPGGGLAGLLSHIPGIGSFFSGGVGAAPKGTATDPVHVVFGGFGGIGGGGIGPGGTAGTFPGTISIPGVGSIPLAPFINAFSSSGGAAGFDTTGTGFGTPSGFSISGAFGGSSGSGGQGFSLSSLFGGGLGGSLAAGGVTAGASIGGGLLLGAGSRRGGALGGLEGAAGGALEGAAAGLVAGPIGAAVGAIIGGIGGLISGILGGPNFGQRVSRDMWLNAYHAPPSETFSFASNGSIANTLSTGFSQSGNQFGKFTLPANTPFYASAITGPLTARQQLLLQQEYNNLGGNQPFGGFNPNPFAGTGIPSIGGQPGPEANAIVGNGGVPISGGSGSGTTNVHFHIQAVDSKSVVDLVNENHEAIAGVIFGRGYSSAGSGAGSRIRQLTTLP